MLMDLGNIGVGVRCRYGFVCIDNEVITGRLSHSLGWSGKCILHTGNVIL